MNYYSGNKRIKIDFTDDDWRKLLNMAKVKDLNEESVRKLFCLAFELFISGSYSIDDLSAVCDRLFSVLVKSGTKKYPELLDGVEAGSELSFYIRDINLLPIFNRFLKDIFDVYYLVSKK